MSRLSAGHGDAMTESQTAPRSHLCLETGGQGYMEPCGDEVPLHGLEGDRSIEISPEVESGALRCGILGQGLMSLVYNKYFGHIVAGLLIRDCKINDFCPHIFTFKM